MNRALLASIVAGIALPAAAQTAPMVPMDGSSTTVDGSLAAGDLAFFDFTLTFDTGGGNWVNIQTFNTTTTETVDTEIAIYDAGGNLIASDDDDNLDDPGFLLYSLLSFGTADPIPNDEGIPGLDGELLAGDYTIVVGGFDTTFGATIDEITAGTSTGDFTLQVAGFKVPAPSAAAVLGLGGLAAARRRR